MKGKIFIASVIFILMACEKENITIYYPGEMPYGKMMAKKEGKEWIASSSARWYDDNTAFFGVSASTYTIEGLLRESLWFNKIPMKTGSYTISGPTNNIFNGFVGSVYHTNQDDGDVLEDYNKVDETASGNYLEITYFDTIANLVKGNFTVTFEISTIGGKVNPNNPDKVKFSDGEFEVEFIK